VPSGTRTSVPGGKGCGAWYVNTSAKRLWAGVATKTETKWVQVIDLSHNPQSSRFSVDNFVDSLSKCGANRDATRVSLECPKNKQLFKYQLNQYVEIATLCIARKPRPAVRVF
jgi:hypothetical protein